jgi:hypothetical protein
MNGVRIALILEFVQKTKHSYKNKVVLKLYLLKLYFKIGLQVFIKLIF